ncbi:MAG: Na(+)-translocating NADH-quinone reductase subunit C [Gammaproteobacteria bacterium]|nr:MAG: Na(+)-translocating NADH-quinone reductase subunit C [Gammaproteobacteria bacterium]
MTENNKNQGFLGNLLSLPNDNPKKTIIVAALLCLVCSILVSTSAVIFKPQQQANKAADIKKNILAVTGLLTEDADVDTLFEQFEIKVVDLATGDYADIDPATYDQRKAAADPTQSIELPADQDIAGIGRRAKFATVYLLKDGDKAKQIVLPIHGYGLWSTLYGFISFEADFNTVGGLQFYAHAETPGLGGEVDNPKWRKQWQGKKAFNDKGELKIEVIRGHVDFKVAGAEHQIDGLSGATLTSRGVSNLVNYWLGKHGFGPYLKKMRAEVEK